MERVSEHAMLAAEILMEESPMNLFVPIYLDLPKPQSVLVHVANGEKESGHLCVSIIYILTSFIHTHNYVFKLFYCRHYCVDTPITLTLLCFYTTLLDVLM